MPIGAGRHLGDFVCFVVVVCVAISSQAVLRVGGRGCAGGGWLAQGRRGAGAGGGAPAQQPIAKLLLLDHSGGGRFGGDCLSGLT